MTITKRRKQRLVNLGVIEFHSESYNPGLFRRFYDTIDDLSASAAIVDLWLVDIAAVLREFGYEMKVWEITGRLSPTETHRVQFDKL